MPSILIADDNEGIRETLREALEDQQYRVALARDGSEALEILQRQSFDLLITDLKMPGLGGLALISEAGKIQSGLKAIVITAFAQLESAVEAMRLGAADYLTKPLRMLEVVERVRNLLDRESLKEQNLYLSQQAHAKYDISRIVGNSPVMRSLNELIRKVAPADATVLLRGETGTGKELVAHVIHGFSLRREKPLIKVNCAALPENLIESELFGHEKGAFTGAAGFKPGRFDLADNGTLFLDEIGDLPFPVQTKLLRVLQEKEFERVGGTRTVRVDVRMISGTHRNLESMIREGLFREDLYYRLNVITLEIPPLRERNEDIPGLAAFFVERFSTQMGKPAKPVAPAALDLLQRYAWPGNIRELENIIERAIVLNDGTELTAADFATLSRANAGPAGARLEDELGRIERSKILEALQKSGGSKSKAAQLLGITRPTLYYKMQRYGIVDPERH